MLNDDKPNATFIRKMVNIRVQDRKEAAGEHKVMRGEAEISPDDEYS